MHWLAWDMQGNKKEEEGGESWGRTWSDLWLVFQWDLSPFPWKEVIIISNYILSFAALN